MMVVRMLTIGVGRKGMGEKWESEGGD